MMKSVVTNYFTVNETPEVISDLTLKNGYVRKHNFFVFVKNYREKKSEQKC